MSQIIRPAEHTGDFANRFHLHTRAGATAVEGMVVGINCHGERIGGAGQWMRRLEHLPCIKGMEVWIVVSHSFSHLAQHCSHGLDCGYWPRLRWQVAK